MFSSPVPELFFHSEVIASTLVDLARESVLPANYWLSSSDSAMILGARFTFISCLEMLLSQPLTESQSGS